MSDDDGSHKEADQRTLIALGFLSLAAVLLIGLTALVVPALLGVVLVVGGMFLFGSAHYIVWGWWLPRFLKRDRDDDADQP